MIRISKDYDERKKEIIDTSLKLFLTHGYEDTSVNLIIETIGISKGAFYYYFKSKEELLDAIVEKRNKDIIERMVCFIEDKNLNAIEKINSIFQQAVREKAETKETLHLIYRVLLDPKYLIIRHKMEKKNVESLAPILKLIIEQGIQEGLFKLTHAEEIAEMLIKLNSVLSDAILTLYQQNDMQLSPDKAIYLTNIYQMAVERILGAPEGSIKLYDTESMIKAFS